MNKALAFTMALPLLVIGAEWQSLNGPPAGRADDMSMGWDPLHNYWVIYAADQTHKLYKSTNEGEYWDSIYTHEDVVNPVCVICEPQNAQVVYIGKNGDVPVWWSIDGGATWEERSGTPPYNITNTRPRCFAMDPFDERIIYLGCKKDGNNPVLFRTTDGGFAWQSLNLSGYDINDILILDFFNEGIILMLATDKGILRGRPYYDFRLVKEGEFELLKYDKGLKKIFVKGADNIYQSSDGKKWEVSHLEEPIDFYGITDIINRRQK